MSQIVIPTLAPSILSADFSRLGEEVRQVEMDGVEFIHVDIMDGHFVPNLTGGPSLVEAIRRNTTLLLDVHMMVTNPDFFIKEMAEAGADIMTVHVETCLHLHRTLQAIRDAGMKAGVAVNPATSLHAVEEALPLVDLLLVMSVNPGFGGQTFIADCLDKIGRAGRMIPKTHSPILLEVDGGIKIDNARAVVEAGAEILVAGSAIFSSSDYRETIRTFQTEMGGGNGKRTYTFGKENVSPVHANFPLSG